MKQEIKPINDTTFEVELLGKDKVEIGDRQSLNFKPHVKLNRWGGECFIKVGLPTKAKKTPIIESGKVKWIDKDIEANLYPLEPRIVIAKDKDGKDVEFKQNELGGFEFEIILKKKPKTNKIVLNIETQGLKFYYQPELTQEEIDEGCVRPDNVVGSYAVYHATRTPFHKSKVDAEKYKCGIAFHIYRPKITDTEGKWVWGELSINEKAGTLTTTIPQEFLDSAVYPISTGTTNFGYETKGGTGLGGMNALIGLFATPASAGNAQSITVWVNYMDDGEKVKTALYQSLSYDSETEEHIHSGARVNTWYTLNFISPPSISVQEYLIAGWVGGSFSFVGNNRDPDEPGNWNVDDYTYNNWPTTLINHPTTYELSIYCTYEAVAPPPSYIPRHSGSVGVLMF